MNRYAVAGRAVLVFIGALALYVLSGCDTVNEQRNFADEASRQPSGFTHTSESGEVLETDPNDWRTSPIYRGVVRIDPAYPNPVTSAVQQVILPFWITDFNAVTGDLTLRAYDDKNNFVPLARREISGPGSFQFDFSPSLLSSSGSVSSIEGLHRLFVFDARGELVTYGDLRIDLEEQQE